MSESYVVKLVTDNELLVKVDASFDVVVDEILEVLDPRTRDVVDPVTHKKLGSLDRPKARVVVVTVSENLALCEVWNRASGGLSAVSRVMAGDSIPSIRGISPSWIEGVVPGDPVKKTNRVRKR